MLNKLVYTIKVLRQRGLTFFWIYFRESIWFDIRHGTSTFSRVPKGEQNIQSSDGEKDNGLLYVASFTSVTRQTTQIAAEILGHDRFAQTQFFDLGCGKGKALMVYARQHGSIAKHPAIGIEYDPSLADLARQNVAKFGLTNDKVNIITDSAANIRSYVKTDTAIIYLYNSFQGETLRATLDSLQGLPHILIYVDPAERDILRSYGYITVKENAGRYNADTWLVAKSGLD